jgi:predicted Zn-dependent protease
VAVGSYDEAEGWVPRLESTAPRRGLAHYRVGAQLLAANQSQRAVEHLARAHQLDPGQPSIEYVLGQALLNAGRPGEAVPHLRRGADAGIPLPAGGFDLAVALHAVGDLAQAERAIRRVQLSDRDDPELWLRAGRLASQVKAPDAAERFFRKAVEMRPEQQSARLQLGLNLLVLGRCGEAARELAEAVRLEPRDADALAHLAYCELELGRDDDARRHVRAALDADQTHALASRLATVLRARE